MSLNSLCFYFVFWLCVGVLLLVVSHLGPAMFTLQFLGSSSLSTCIEESTDTILGFKCKATFKPSDIGIYSSFSLRIYALPETAFSLPAIQSTHFTVKVTNNGNVADKEVSFTCIDSKLDKRNKIGQTYNGCVSQIIFAEDESNLKDQYEIQVMLQEEEDKSPTKKRRLINRILLQVMASNSQHGVENVLRTVLVSVSIGFLAYTLYQLKNFYSTQLLRIQKWLQYLLISLILFNDPLAIFNLSSTPIVNGFSAFGELAFLSLVMYFWLDIEGMNAAVNSGGTEGQSLDQQPSKNARICLSFVKLIVVLMNTAPQLVMRTATGQWVNEATLEEIQMKAQIVYSVWVCVKILKVCIESGIEKNFKFLCYFTYAVFAAVGYVQYQQQTIPKEELPTYFALSRVSLLNVYVYVITFLYLPVEHKEGEQKYSLDHAPEQHEEEPLDEEERSRNHILDEVYKDIDGQGGEGGGEGEEDSTSVPKKQQQKKKQQQQQISETVSEEELRKQKAWASIQKSLEDDEEEEDGGVFDDDNDYDEDHDNDNGEGEMYYNRPTQNLRSPPVDAQAEIELV